MVTPSAGPGASSASVLETGPRIAVGELHVGPGTFLPLAEAEIDRNTLSSEAFEIHSDAIGSIKEAKARGNRVIAVGTTVTRVLESAYERRLFETLESGETYRGDTDLFIYPGYRFNVVDALLTNFPGGITHENFYYQRETQFS